MLPNDALPELEKESARTISSIVGRVLSVMISAMLACEHIVI